MALARTRRQRGVDYWPGFVDALSTLILAIIFMISIFAIVQFFLSQEVTGKDTALSRLSARINQLTELLSLEQTNKGSLEDQIAQLRASLATSESERDRIKGLYDNLSGGSTAAQGRVSELTGQLDAEKQVTLRALAQIEVLSQLASGRRDREIAKLRFTSECTVRSHVTQIFGKLGVRSRLEAALVAHGVHVDPIGDYDLE